MPNVINADNGVSSGSAGLKSSSDGTGILALQTNGTTAVTVDASQNVGIGTSSPGARLQVTNTDGEMARFRTSSGSNQPVITISASDSAATVGFATGGNASFPAMTFANGGSERMRIDSSGNLLVGTTSTGNTSTGFKVIANGSAILAQDSTSDGPLFQFVDINASTPNGYRFASFRFGAAATEIGTITKSSASAVAYNTTSDYRLKEDIAPMTGALAKVAQLKPVTYKWKADGSDGQGFIAHELQAVVSDCVTGEKDAVDENGNPRYQGIDTSFLVATLTAAIQELTARIEALEAK